MASEMQDRIAQAIASAVGEKNPLEPALLRDSFYSDAARAVLEAMREPTDDMIDRGIFTRSLSSQVGPSRHWTRCVWRSMVEEALGAQEENAIFRSLYQKHKAAGTFADE